MASIAWASFGLVFLLAYPYDSRLLSPLVFAGRPAVLPGHGQRPARTAATSCSDIFRDLRLQPVLLPVNLAGVLKSIQQAVTGEKIPFARTPKVKDRTAAPALYVARALPDRRLLAAHRVARLHQPATGATWPSPRSTRSSPPARSSPTSAYSTPWSTSRWASSTGCSSQSEPAGGPTETNARRHRRLESILYHGDRRLDRDLRGATTGGVGSAADGRRTPLSTPAGWGRSG